MTIEVPLPDLTALPAWAYVTGGVWVWYLTNTISDPILLAEFLRRSEI